MTVDAGKTEREYAFDRHARDFRLQFERDQTADLHAGPRIAWNDTHGGYWFVNGNQEVFDVARRADVLSNDDDSATAARVPGDHHPAAGGGSSAGFLETDPPRQRLLPQRDQRLPVARRRWRGGSRSRRDHPGGDRREDRDRRMDFVDDLANVVPAVLTMALLGLPLEDWVVYYEPAHAGVYTPSTRRTARA